MVLSEGEAIAAIPSMPGFVNCDQTLDAGDAGRTLLAH